MGSTGFTSNAASTSASTCRPRPTFSAASGQETNRAVPVGRERFRPDGRDRVGAGEDSAARGPRHDRAQPVPGYFNIWRWILPKLTPAERGGKKANPKPEAILKYAATPIPMLAGLWEDLLAEWERDVDEEPATAGVHPGLQEHSDRQSDLRVARPKTRRRSGIPPAKIAGFLNTDRRTNTIRVDSKVVARDRHGRGQERRERMDAVHARYRRQDRLAARPAGAADLSGRLRGTGRRSSSDRCIRPGRDVRCIVSVGMLTEGWDCNTVTHIVGLRPFMSQLLCEQVVGRGLRRRATNSATTASSRRKSRRYSGCRSRSSRSRKIRAARAPP